MNRYDIWLMDLGEETGVVMRKIRPGIIISPPGMNRRVGTVLIVPMTSNQKVSPFRLPSNFQNIPGSIAFDQLRCLGKGDLMRRLGRLCDEEAEKVRAMLLKIFRQ